MESLLLLGTASGRRLASQGRSLVRLFCLGILLNTAACGVKGDPLPPEAPPRIGTGEPNFTKGISSAPEEDPQLPIEDDYEEEEEE